MKKYLTNNVIRFIFALILSMAVSSLLLSIEWFTWQAWLFVSLMLLWKFYLVDADMYNTAGLWRNLFKKIDELKNQKEVERTQRTTQMSTRKPIKRRNRPKKEIN